MSIYNTDFYSWTQDQAALLKAERFTEIDLQNLIEEVESMGRSEKRALESRLSILLLHMLKWHYQSERRSHSWKFSIDEQRLMFQKVLKQNPGLKPEIPAIVVDAYEYALLRACHETGLRADLFPNVCPWSFEQLCNSAFYPD